MHAYLARLSSAIRCILLTDKKLEELIERLVVLDKIEKGRTDVREGNTVTHEEARSKLTK